MTDAPELIIFTDEDGMPWAAFVWGIADPDAVAARITPEAVEDQTGCDIDYYGDDISWPPRVQAYWMMLWRDEYPDEGDTYKFCDEGTAGAIRVTGHRFYPR